MNRRDFAVAVAMGPLAAKFALAATDPVAGKDYVQLTTPVPVAVAGKIEVIEFFGYWCPHCKDLEPKLEPWAKALPADVNFRRIPVAWQAPHIPYQKLFFALEAMGVGNDAHAKVFKAFHEQRLRMDNEAAISAFAAAIGVDKGKLMEAFNGFTVATKIRAASQQVTSYQIEGVPTLAVNGKFMTSPEMAKGELQALHVVDVLIQKARSQR